MPVLRIPGALGRYAGGITDIAVDAASVGEALEEACRRHPDLRLRVIDEFGLIRSHLAIFRNDEQLRREEAAAAALEAGDTLTLLVAVGGG